MNFHSNTMVDRSFRKVFFFRPSRLVGFFCFAFLLLGCKKDELKRPTPVRFYFDVEHEAYSSEYDAQEKDARDPWEDGGGDEDGETTFSVTPQYVNVNLRSIRLLGSRKEGDDVDFKRTVNRSISLEEGRGGERLRFDLPEGTYTKLNVEIRFGGGGQNALACEGRYETQREGGPAEATPFRFLTEEERIVSLEVRTKDGSRGFELKEGKVRGIQIHMETLNWYKELSTNLWEDIDTVEDPDGEGEYILIEEGQNPDLHSTILERFDAAFKARIL